MKKIFILAILIILFLAGCNNASGVFNYFNKEGFKVIYAIDNTRFIVTNKSGDLIYITVTNSFPGDLLNEDYFWRVDLPYRVIRYDTAMSLEKMTK